MIFARSNMMREITPLHFPHLSVLDLSNNELEALPHFDLPNLIHLDVSQNKLSGRLDVALGLVSDPLMHSSAVIWPAVLYKSLQYLDLSGNDFGDLACYKLFEFLFSWGIRVHIIKLYKIQPLWGKNILFSRKFLDMFRNCFILIGWSLFFAFNL